MSTDFVRYTRSPKSFDLVLKSRPFFTYAAKHFEKGDALAVNSWRVTPEHPYLARSWRCDASTRRRPRSVGR